MGKYPVYRGEKILGEYTTGEMKVALESQTLLPTDEVWDQAHNKRQNVTDWIKATYKGYKVLAVYIPVALLIIFLLSKSIFKNITDIWNKF